MSSEAHLIAVIRSFYKVTPSANGCFEWTGATNRPGGYGQVRVGGRRGKALYLHRLAYEVVHGEVPAGLYVLHRCDNPRCVNPEHLFVGTQKQNINDCKNKGRLRNQYSGDYACATL